MYTIYPSKTAAIVANVQAAEAAGCSMVTTIELHHRVNHPTDGRSALKDGVGPTSHAELEADGWFAYPDPSAPVGA